MTILRKTKLQRRETRCNSGWMLAIRPSFTLVELLVVIVIIALLAGMTMVALAGAQRDAEVARTRSTIRKINEILLGKWEEFSTRALPIELPAVAMRPDITTGTIPVAGQEVARMRLVGLRDLMRMEMPDRLTDILYTPTTLNLEVVVGNSRTIYPLGGLPYSSLWSNYREKIYLPPAAPATAGPFPVGSFRPGFNIANSNAELLYLVVATSSNNGIGGLESFHATEIGDTDQDGYPEFIDAWGRPIKWIRWPAGALWSEIVASSVADARLLENRGGDAMDATKSDWRYANDTPAPASWLDNPFTLQPLVLSGGPDGAFDIVFDVTDIDPSSTPITFATQRLTFPIPLVPAYQHAASPNYYFPDPYRSYSVSGNDIYLGQIFDYDSSGSHEDNITSHDTLFDQ